MLASFALSTTSFGLGTATANASFAGVVPITSGRARSRPRRRRRNLDEAFAQGATAACAASRRARDRGVDHGQRDLGRGIDHDRWSLVASDFLGSLRVRTRSQHHPDDDREASARRDDDDPLLPARYRSSTSSHECACVRTDPPARCPRRQLAERSHYSQRQLRHQGIGEGRTVSMPGGGVMIGCGVTIGCGVANCVFASATSIPASGRRPRATIDLALGG